MSSSRRFDGQPETKADKRFFDHRESGYKGPIDHKGNKIVDEDKWLERQKRWGRV